MNHEQIVQQGVVMAIRKYLISIVTIAVLTVASAATPGNSLASESILSKGQSVYVPVYSNIFTGPKKVSIHLANSLIIRNRDIYNEIQVTAADYYDTKGTLIKKIYQTPVTLAPLETTYIYLSERDKEGGLGANFIIRWNATKEVNAPLIECLMVGNQGRAFVSPGQAIREDTK